MIGKALLLVVGLAFAIGAPAQAKDKPAPFKIDIAHTAVTFSVNHFGFSTAYGRFKSFELAVQFDPNKPEKTTVDMTIDAASIDTGWPARDDDLRGKNFFNVAQFPKIIFKSTKVERTGIDTAKLTGDLTFLGVTKPLNLDLKLAGRGPHPFRSDVQVVAFNGTGVLKRSEFGMTALTPGIGDDVTLTISTELNNAPPKPAK